MPSFKLWLHLEALDDETGEGFDIGEPDDLGRFDTEEEANAYALRILHAFAPDQIEYTHRSAPMAAEWLNPPREAN